MLQPTIEKLTAMRLNGMVSAIRDLDAAPPSHELAWQERLALVIDREWQEREERRLRRRIKEAKLTKRASVEDVVTDPARGIDKPILRELLNTRWIDNKHNLILVGATGTGKTYLAAALAEYACRKGLRALFIRVPRLFEELAIARAQGSYAATLTRLQKFNLIVLDDFLMAPLSDVERRDLLELLEDRYDVASTIFTSQVPTKTWHSAIGDPTIADAICDRILHNAKHITLKGASLRKKQPSEIQS
jgi:DNA replication protein DnaC